MKRIYDLMGWTEQQAYQRRKFPHLQLRIAAQLGLAAQVKDMGAWLRELAEEEGIPPIFERVVQKPEAYRQAAVRSASRTSSKRVASDPSESPSLLLMKSQATLHPRPLRRDSEKKSGRYKRRKGGRE